VLALGLVTRPASACAISTEAETIATIVLQDMLGPFATLNAEVGMLLPALEEAVAMTDSLEMVIANVMKDMKDLSARGMW